MPALHKALSSLWSSNLTPKGSQMVAGGRRPPDSPIQSTTPKWGADSLSPLPLTPSPEVRRGIWASLFPRSPISCPMFRHFHLFCSRITDNGSRLTVLGRRLHSLVPLHLQPPASRREEEAFRLHSFNVYAGKMPALGRGFPFLLREEGAGDGGVCKP